MDGWKQEASTGAYRHGFQGLYADRSVDGSGFNTFELRLYDPAIGRWTTMDPKGQYPSPYVGMGNNPVDGVDPDGGDWFKNSETGKSEWFENHPGEGWSLVAKDQDEVVIRGEKEYRGINPLGYMYQMYQNKSFNSNSAQYTAFREGSDIAAHITLSFVPLEGAGVLLGLGGKYVLKAGTYLLRGGKTFNQYKALYWANKVKPTLEPIIDPVTGKVWKQYMELHHRFIPQRWGAPNWLTNNSWNLKAVTSLEHALQDPYRARFAPTWIKETFGLTWK